MFRRAQDDADGFDNMCGQLGRLALLDAASHGLRL